MLPRHYETTGLVAADITRVFEHLDDHTRLSAHMSKSSWKMGGGKMEMDFDERKGKSVGARIRLSGRVFGLPLSVEEVVTVREPPYRKIWETIGTVRLLVIEGYRLGFELNPADNGARLRIFIDYELPHTGFERICGLLFGAYYAKWCTRQMLVDATTHFASGANRLTIA